MKDKIKRLLEKNERVYNYSLSIYIKLYNVSLFILGVMFLIFPVNKKKIVMCNHLGDGYSDNLKYITEEIIEKDYKWEIVWLLKKELMTNHNIPETIKTIEYNSIRGLYELATAKIWIDNWRKVFKPIKKKEQHYIQTWHGGLSIKKIEKDAIVSLDKNYINVAKKDSRNTDIILSNSEFANQLFKKSFWYSGEILKVGSPRNDLFFTELSWINKKVKEYFSIDKTKKIVLYAPTFRKNQGLTSYKIDFEKIIKKLKEKEGEDWIFLVRLHPNISKKSSEMKIFSNSIINATHYPDMQELLAVSNMIISDYSSCMFDGSLLNTPTFIYATDIKEYSNDRGTYFNFEELPFPVSQTNDELIKNILEFNQDNYETELGKFNEKVGLFEKGIAAKEIVKHMENVVNM